MDKLCEFRINEDFANLLFRPDEGKRLGDSVRKILISTADARFKQINDLQHRIKREHDEPLYFSSTYFYRYTSREIESAELFRIRITAALEPAGEECGTVYDESETCSGCGAGRKLASDLVLDLRKAPKTKDIAGTIACDETIISQRLAELMVDAKLTGFDLAPVRHKARYKDDPMRLSDVSSGRKLLEQATALGLSDPEWEFYVWLNRPEQKELLRRARTEHAELRADKARRHWRSPPVWYQLVVTSNPVPIVPPTQTGNGPFDDDPDDKYRCPFGHVIGLRLLSEVSVARDAWDGSDVVRTSNMTGHRMGLLVPAPCLLISPRFYRLLRDHKIKGYKSEIAYLV